jgi:translocator protein
VRSLGALAVFLVLVSFAALFGAWFEPGLWYAGLHKPPLTPPNWLFGPVWSVLYLAIAVAAWLVWRSPRRSGLALTLWGAQLLLNATWSFLFFGLQRPGLALVEIVALLLLVAVTAASFYRVLPLAGALLTPYAAWVGFAAYLNAGLWYLNR